MVTDSTLTRRPNVSKDLRNDSTWKYPPSVWIENTIEGPELLEAVPGVVVAACGVNEGGVGVILISGSPEAAAALVNELNRAGRSADDGSALCNEDASDFSAGKLLLATSNEFKRLCKVMILP